METIIIINSFPFEGKVAEHSEVGKVINIKNKNKK